jgi:hypothetical protein
MDAEEKENQRQLEEKRAILEKTMHEIAEMRSESGGSSIGRGSPPEKTKKKTGTLGLFNRN